MVTTADLWPEPCFGPLIFRPGFLWLAGAPFFLWLLIRQRT
jgi:ABC-type Fe3+-siderophore transport system permease subunit